MKYWYTNYVAAFLLLSFLFSCSGTRTINLSLMRPAVITLDPSIKTIALLNRALPPETKSNEVEALVTGEGKNEDKKGRQNLLEGLNFAFTQSPNFKGILLTDELMGDGTGTTFPPPLSWDVIEQICKNNNTDAVVSLETYDSDCIITHVTGQVGTTNAFGLTIPTISYNATQKIIIKAGIRIYDLKNRTIADEYSFSYWRTWNASGTGLGEAIAGLINRELAINQTCYDAGGYYEKRISPVWVSERRTLFTRAGHNPMAVGSRMALVGNWTDAATYWQEALKRTSKRKKCGRACFNLALAAEVNGDLAGAKDWIGKSFGVYNIQEALYYQNTINRRYNEMLRLQQQFQNVNDK